MQHWTGQSLQFRGDLWHQASASVCAGRFCLSYSGSAKACAAVFGGVAEAGQPPGLIGREWQRCRFTGAGVRRRLLRSFCRAQRCCQHGGLLDVPVVGDARSVGAVALRAACTVVDG